MERPTDTLAQQAAALAELVREAAWAGEEASLAEVADGLTDRALIDCLERLGALVNLADAVGSRLAGVLAQRSERDSAEPLAKRLGARSAPLAVAAAHVSVSRAAEWCKVGRALAVRRSLTGDPLPSLHESVAAALDTGAICSDAARMIVETITQVAPRALPEKVQAWEAFLVNETLENGTARLGQACRAVIARADDDAVELREEELRARAGLKVVKRRDGLTRLVVDADPESAGWLVAALDARTAPRREVRFTDPEEPAMDEATIDRRTASQKRLDALVSMARESLKHDPGDLSGTAATLLVGISYESLVSGVGAATIYGTDEKISAKTARRIACAARILPVVLGGDSQILDFGEGRRLFSESQRYAMAWRDGGCVWPGCDQPPARCEAAHLAGWHQGDGQPHGRTDLSNGVLLCPFHHRRIDNDGWTIEFREGIPYLIPPPWVDPTRRPRRAGRAEPPG
ncbi:HNH endonuclease signature motif containing protein [Naasia sp. SYSU D00948]|uniref:HNH endonuclease signature motif containing protein n=1 Tax=Naasia sp. SYSU D00948 TaxID=2817379 RepID=UPI001B310838|nr:HNH endonuclease signature motif containing protein [Naasia sp. SYSU D00948]